MDLEESDNEKQPLRVIAVTSGKGGVGKSSIIINLAVHFCKQGKRVLLLDADTGLANVDIMLGIDPIHHMGELLSGDCTMDEVLVEGPAGLMILPAASGVFEMAELSEEHQIRLMAEMESLEDRFDVVLIDTGAGISQNVLYFSAAAQEVLVVTTPEPTAITDAYAIMKVLNSRYQIVSFKLLVNSVKNPNEALSVYKRLVTVAESHLNISIDYMGHVFQDETVSRAIRARKPLMLAAPNCLAAKCIRGIGDQLLETQPDSVVNGGMQFFWNRLLKDQTISSH
jgi:flagellar biosynthesis protein FlhG